MTTSRRDMARRPLCEWPDHTYYPALDVTRRERIGQVIGVLVFAVIFVAVALLSGGPS